MNRLCEMTWEEVEQLPKTTLFILPLGSTEQHGQRLPLGTDHFAAGAWAKRVAKETPNSVLMPLLTYGMSRHHTAFPGTVSLNPATYMAVVQDLVRSVAQHGFYNILVVNGHGGNDSWINEAIKVLKDEFPHLNIANPSVPIFIEDPDVKTLIELFDEGIVHAGAMETSLLAAIRSPEDLRDESVVTHVPSRTEWGVGTDSPASWKEKFPMGAKGDQRATNFDLGKQLNELFVRRLIAAGKKLIAAAK